ncbi:MAG: AraC family transcriptional regulator [Pseudomonadales bacterium]
MNKHMVVRKPIVDHVYRYLQRLGIDTASLITRFRFDPPEVEGLDPAIAMADFYQLLEEAVRLTGDGSVGLKIYQKIDSADFGLYGYAIQNSSSIRHAMEVNARYHYMMQSDTMMELEDDGEDNLSCTYKLLDHEVGECRHDVDLSLSAIVYTVRHLSGQQEWAPLRATFTFAQPEDISAYQEIMACPLEFGAPKSSVLISSDMAKSPIEIGGDERLFAILDKNLQQIMDSVTEGAEVVKTVRQLVVKSLGAGSPSIDDIASQLCMSRRSLQRRLEAEGFSFKELVEDIRRQLASRYLGNTEYPLVEVAFLLGYSDLSAFSRAFRRWYGEPPQSYRNNRLAI